jgi:hypothetical protein
VTYDYAAHSTISIPNKWREKISKFEELRA